MASKNNGGDMAREMAAAPLSVRETVAEKINRFAAVFTAVLFTVAENGQVNEREKSGLKSRKLANVLVEVGGTGGYIRGSIYARLPKGATVPYAEFTFTGTQFASAFCVRDEQAKEDLNEWRRSVADLYADWRKENGIAAAAAPTTGPVLDGITF
jgi:hypothetical protein